MLTMKVSENIGIEEMNNRKKAEIKHLKLALGRFLNKTAESINKISTMLIGIIKTDIIFLRRNKSILI